MSAALNSNHSTQQQAIEVSSFRRAQMERIERNIAPSFRERRQWVLWTLETRVGEDKPTKMPYQINGRRAKSDTPETWTTLAEVKNAYILDGALEAPKFSGVGYMCNADETIVDLDHCFDASGALNEQAREIVERLKSYTEISQSGNGLHIWATPVIFEITDDPDPKKRYRHGRKNADTQVEMYCERRFVAMTGNHLEGTPDTVEAREQALRAVLNDYIDAPRQAKRAASKASQPTGKSADTAEIISLDDKLMMERVKVLDGAAYKWLTEGYGKKRIDDKLMSETDYGVMVGLVKCGAPDDQIVKLIYGSKLKREKFDRHPTYLVDTVRNARAAVGGERYVYDETNTVEAANVWDVINGLNLSDRGNAIILSGLLKDRSRAVFVQNEKLWYTYTDETANDPKRLGLWVGNNNRALRLIDDVVRVLEGKHEIIKNAAKAAEADGDKDNVKYFKFRAQEVAQWIKSCQSGSHPARMLEHVEGSVAVSGDIFDADPYILSVANGLLDLRTRTLRPCTAHDYITQRINTAYNPQARSEDWAKFVRMILGENDSLVSYVQRAAGYSLVGKVTDNAVFILYGEGGNGKSVFTRTLSGVLDGHIDRAGGYSVSLNERVLMETRSDGGDSPSPALMSLRHKRFVRAREAKGGDAFDTAKIKQLASPDEIAVRGHGGYYFEFAPTHKLWLSTNIMPRVNQQDDGIWDRLKIIRFPNRFRDTEMEDTGLTDFFSTKESREAVLNWMLDGTQAWIENGERLDEPNAVAAETEWLRRESNEFAAFGDEYLVFDGTSFIPSGFLFDSFTSFWTSNYSMFRHSQPKKSQIIEGFRRLKLRDDSNKSGEVVGKERKTVRGFRGARFMTVAEFDELHPLLNKTDAGLLAIRESLAKVAEKLQQPYE